MFSLLPGLTGLIHLFTLPLRYVILFLIKNNDIWHLGLGRTAHQIISWLSYLGLLFLLFQFPLIIAGNFHIAFLPVLIILAAPFISRLLLSALSRTREYDADIGAVNLTGDTGSYISALKKLSLQPFRLFGFIIFRHTKRDNSSLFQTHPAVRQRIHRLEELARHEPGVIEIRNIPGEHEKYY
ncbi:MAG: M48 family metalloprotease [Spirochaetales bacterium]|nr:M48 family metalloprotease [Spirochaetales bacterium]